MKAAALDASEPLVDKLIDGDTGPPMIGVSTYPYSVAQKLYKDDFEQMVASTITHPYISTTNMGQGSCPQTHSAVGQKVTTGLELNLFEEWIHVGF